MYGRYSHVPARVAAASLMTLLALPAAARAQEVAEEPDRGGGYFQIGYMMIDLEELNASLIGAGYPELEESFVTLGGGGFGMQGRFRLGGEGHALIGSEETTADGTTRLQVTGGYGLFRLGYLAYSRAGVDVFPMLGVGGGGLSVSVVERSAPTFDDVLADPQRSSTLSTGSFLLDASVALSYRLSMGEAEPAPADEEREGGLLLGIQTGYTFAPGNPSWHLDGINNVAGGPELAIEGFYVRLSIGGWGG